MLSCQQERLIVLCIHATSLSSLLKMGFDWFGNTVIHTEIANVGKPNLCDWPRLWSVSSLIGHVFKIRKEWIIDDVDNDEE